MDTFDSEGIKGIEGTKGGILEDANGILELWASNGLLNEELSRIEYSVIDINQSALVEKIVESLFHNQLVYERTLEERLNTWVTSQRSSNGLYRILNSKPVIEKTLPNATEFLLYKQVSGAFKAPIIPFKRKYGIMDNEMWVEPFGDMVELSKWSEIHKHISIENKASILLQIFSTVEHALQHTNFVNVAPITVWIVPTTLEWIPIWSTKDVIQTLEVKSYGYRAIIDNWNDTSAFIEMNGNEYLLGEESSKEFIIEIKGIFSDTRTMKELLNKFGKIVRPATIVPVNSLIQPMKTEVDQYSALRLAYSGRDLTIDTGGALLFSAITQLNTDVKYYYNKFIKAKNKEGVYKQLQHLHALLAHLAPDSTSARELARFLHINAI